MEERSEGRAKKNAIPATKTISHKRVLELFLYDPITGHLIRRKSGKIMGVKQKGRSLVDVDGITIRVHRVIWFYMTGEWPEHVDHKNGIHWDNRWENLRNATHTQNCRNRRKNINNTTGYKGVGYRQDMNKYQAAIRVNRKAIHLGYFTDSKEAAAAYNDAAIKYFGEFARLNDLGGS